MPDETPTVAQPVAATTLSGKFGRYEIVRLLGKGGMGAVYLAKQTALDRPAVIKVILTEGDDDSVERFEREAKAAAKITSDNVVQVFETGVERGIPYIAMEYVEGRSAADMVKEKGRLGWADATRLVASAARGLAAAHELGILHRDVKPANILVGNDGRVKVADFGLAKFVQGQGPNPALTATGVIVGTPHYMAPEQADGKPLDARADLYALGATWFHLLTGRYPYDSTTVMGIIQKVLMQPVPRARDVQPDVPVEVDRLCARLMAKNREERPRNAEEALAELAGLLEVPEPAMKRADEGQAESSRAAIVLACVAGVLVTGIVGLLLLARQGGKEPEPVVAETVAPAATTTVPVALPARAPAPRGEPLPQAPWDAARCERVGRDCQYRFMLDDPDYRAIENDASEAIAHLPQDPGIVDAGLRFLRGSCRVLRDDFAKGEEDLDRVTAASQKEYIDAGRLASLCGALLAHDPALLARRGKELQGSADWARLLRDRLMARIEVKDLLKEAKGRAVFFLVARTSARIVPAWTPEQCAEAVVSCREKFKAAETSADYEIVERKASEAIDHDSGKAAAKDVGALYMVRGACRSLRHDFERGEKDIESDVSRFVERPHKPRLALVCAALLAGKRDLAAKRAKEIETLATESAKDDAKETAKIALLLLDHPDDPTLRGTLHVGDHAGVVLTAFVRKTADALSRK